LSLASHLDCRAAQNARKHGHYTRTAIAERRSLQDLLRQSRKLLQGIG